MLRSKNKCSSTISHVKWIIIASVKIVNQLSLLHLYDVNVLKEYYGIDMHKGEHTCVSLTHTQLTGSFGKILLGGYFV